jgi:hypothetical protein
MDAWETEFHAEDHYCYSRSMKQEFVIPHENPEEPNCVDFVRESLVRFAPDDTDRKYQVNHLGSNRLCDGAPKASFRLGVERPPLDATIGQPASRVSPAADSAWSVGATDRRGERGHKSLLHAAEPARHPVSCAGETRQARTTGCPQYLLDDALIWSWSHVIEVDLRVTLWSLSHVIRDQ